MVVLESYANKWMNGHTELNKLKLLRFRINSSIKNLYMSCQSSATLSKVNITLDSNDRIFIASHLVPQGE